ncbi:Mth938-like domain-containing protein [Burkholderia pseudomultivorans]|nr:Mth938-like domain-containing protein [Burkholderia pseudomultivorans]
MAVPGPRRRASGAGRRAKPAARARAARPDIPLTEPRNTDLKLHQDTSGALNTVTGYGPDYVDVNLERHETSVIVLPGAPVREWPVASFDALAPEHFAMLLDPAPELVIFGSGARLRFPHPRLLAALAAKRIGVETMDFQAACRTYNILMAEGRKVAAALLIER